MKTLFSLTLIFSLQLMSCNAHTPKPGNAHNPDLDSIPGFQNPVWSKDFPDPNLVKAPDGYFYAYSTNVNWTNAGLGGPHIIPILRSKNLVDWEFVNAALDKKPDWKAQGGIWAPDAAFYKGKYHLYYSYSTWGDPNPGIGLAIGEKPEGPFTDMGKVFLSKEIGVANSIDPFFIEDDGKPYLLWGSFHGIYGVQLSEDGTQPIGEKFQLAGTAYEGTYILKKDGYYYFFGSVGSCCEGANSTYHVKVGRASTLKGPYLDKVGKSIIDNGGTLLLESNKSETGFVGTGHNGDIVTDNKGQTWMIYHAYSKQKPNKGRLMLLDKIEWVGGWPTIKNKQPELGKQEMPAF